jgi:hypothetical protein
MRCALEAACPIKGCKTDLVSRLMEHLLWKQSTKGSAQSAVAAPPARDTIADVEEDSGEEEEFRSA